jgi:hypothetical protein
MVLACVVPARRSKPRIRNILRLCPMSSDFISTCMSHRFEHLCWEYTSKAIGMLSAFRSIESSLEFKPHGTKAVIVVKQFIFEKKSP